MARPKISIDVRIQRLAKAKAEAARLNAKLPPRVYASPTPSGRVIVRYEPKTGKKKTFCNAFGTIEFDREHLAFREGSVPANPVNSSSPREIETTKYGTVSWLVAHYLSSNSFLSYSKRDQRVRKGILDRICASPLMPNDTTGEHFRDLPLREFGERAIRVIRDRFAKFATVPDEMYPADEAKARRVPTTPEAGNSAVRVIRALLGWGKDDYGHMFGNINWGHSVKLFASGEGHKTWEPSHCARFEARHKPGTLKRLIYDLARYTGQRRGDLARLSPSMLSVSGGKQILTVKQAKGRNRSPATAYVPMRLQLFNAIAAAKESGILGSHTFIEKSNGQPYSCGSLGIIFREACLEAGLDDYSLHGLRKTSVVDMVKDGWTIFQIMSVTGHKTEKEVIRYSREFDRESASIRASGTNIRLAEAGVSSRVSE